MFFRTEKDYVVGQQELHPENLRRFDDISLVGEGVDFVVWGLVTDMITYSFLCLVVNFP